MDPISGIGSATSTTSVQSTQTSSASGSSSSSSQASSSSSTTSNTFYSSPIFTLDALTGAYITEWRDTKTGEELYQSPTRAALLYGGAQDLPPTPPKSSTSAANDQTTKSVSLYG